VHNLKEEVMDGTERKKVISKIARLYYVEGLIQQKIADKLNISRTKVSRYLDAARKEKIVEIKINPGIEDYSKIEYEIEKKFKIKECSVVPSFESREETLRMMADPFNNLLERILVNGSYMGIGWGSSLKAVSDCLNVNGKSDIKVVPIIGCLGRIGTGIHTNSVAKNIADKLGSISYMIHSPAVLDSREIRMTVEKDSNTREILELSTKIETALIGLSDIGPDSSLIKTGSFSMEEFRYLQKLGVIGDVNLIFINKEGKHVPNKIDERIVRISPDRLKGVKNVIGVAFGKRKLPVIVGALRGGLINILFTDEETAKDIIRSG
jgi:DNA-binding transcriptional regulator LsrR (DeoR family)